MRLSNIFHATEYYQCLIMCEIFVSFLGQIVLINERLKQQQQQQELFSVTHPWISFLALNIWLSGLSYFLCYHIPRTLPRDLQSPPLLERVDQSESTLDKYSWFPDSNVWASLCRSAASHLDFSQRQTTFSYEWKVKKSVELKLGSILHWDRRKQKKAEEGRFALKTWQWPQYQRV